MYMKKKEIPEEKIQELINDYVENLLSSNILSKKYNIPKKTVLLILKENNVVLRNSGRLNLGGKTIADKKYREKNLEKLKQYYSKWQSDNRDNLNEYHKKWRNDNIESHRMVARNYEKNRKHNDPIYKLTANFRTAIYTVLKESNIIKTNHYFDMLGYSEEDLKKHLENLFTNGMTWENYGKWHVDHIKPISSFVFESVDDAEFKKCWSLNNLQPLWGTENLKKSKKYLI